MKNFKDFMMTYNRILLKIKIEKIKKKKQTFKKICRTLKLLSQLSRHKKKVIKTSK